MKNTLKIIGIIALLALVVFSMGACKKDKAAPVAAPSAPSVSSTGWDAYLSDAEKLVNEIVPLMAKAQAGDASASVALAQAIEKFDALEGKYSNLSTDNMTEAQAVKFMSLMERMNP